MRTHIKRNAPVWLLAGACVVWFESASVAQPEQKAPGNAPKEVTQARSSSKTGTTKPAKTVILARNTPPTPKPGTAGSTTATKPLTGEEKKAVSRCWKRLMNMVREVNHAHRAKKQAL